MIYGESITSWFSTQVFNKKSTQDLIIRLGVQNDEQFDELMKLLRNPFSFVKRNWMGKFIGYI
jgi:hypothetical protein